MPLPFPHIYVLEPSYRLEGNGFPFPTPNLGLKIGNTSEDEIFKINSRMPPKILYKNDHASDWGVLVEWVISGEVLVEVCVLVLIWMDGDSRAIK